MKKKLVFGILVGLFLLMVAINLYTPLYSDDLYMTQYPSVLDVIKASVDDYFHWNGRFVGQTIFRLLVYVPAWLFALANTAMFCLLAFISLLLASPNWQKLSPLKLLSIISLFVLFLPAFGQTILWRAGAGNYLWTTTIILAVLVPYYNKSFETSQTRVFSSIFLYPYLTILGLAAGLSNENTSGGLLLCLIGVLIYDFVTKKKIALWQIYGFIMTLIGFIILLMAPGNKVRAAATVGTDYLTLKNMIFSITSITEALYKEHLWLFVAIAVCATLAYSFWFDIKQYIVGVSFTLVGLATLYALILSPLGHEGGRPFFGGIVFLILGLVSFLPENFTDEVTRKISSPFAAALLVIVFFTTIVGFRDYYQSSEAIKERYALIAEKPTTDIIEVPPLEYQPQTRFAINYELEDVSEDPNVFPNAGYQVYFGVKGIVLEETEE